MNELFGGSTLLLCITVFCSRILDVSVGTVRMVSIVKGKSLLAMCLGFCEVFIWFTVAREALQSASGVSVGIAYAGGYATGTLVGSLLSRFFSRGKVQIQVVTTCRDEGLVEAIRAAGYGVTAIEVNAAHDGRQRYMLLADIDGRQQEKFCTLVRQLDPAAFVTVSETKAAYNGYYAYPGHSVRK